MPEKPGGRESVGIEKEHDMVDLSEYTIPPRITIVGTAHVVPLKAQIQQVIDKFRPDIVALEIDYGRLSSLLDPKKKQKRIRNPILYLLSAVQQRAAKTFGNPAGTEFVDAYRIARDHGIRVVLIDQSFEVTTQRVGQVTGIRDAFTILISDIIRPLLMSRKSYKKEMQKVLDDPRAHIAQVREQYPHIYKVLIDERDEIMAEDIQYMIDIGHTVVAFVGDAHVNGIAIRLQCPTRKISFNELRNMRVK